MNESAEALWYTAPGQAEIRQEPLAVDVRSGEVRIDSEFGCWPQRTPFGA